LTVEAPLACNDCKAIPGSYHHVGCGVEKCPACGKQITACGHAHELILTMIDSDVPEESESNPTALDDEEVTVEVYVAAMKSALEAFADTWKSALAKGNGTAKLTFAIWNDKFVDFIDQSGDDEDEEAEEN
jgi:hypothetical protein